MGTPSPVLRFGPFELRTHPRELYKHGIKLKVRPQPLQVLHTLLSRAGAVVSRDDLRRELWTAETFVDFEHSLNTAMRELRTALGDAANEPRYIETLPRIGYRFVDTVETVCETPPPGTDGVPVHGSTPGVKLETRKRAWQLLIGAPVLLIALLGGYLAWSHVDIQRKHVIASKTPSTVSKDASHGADNVHQLAAGSAEAQDLYLKGMYFWNKRTIPGFQQAIEDFRQATALDPNYGAAYAGLANSYTLLAAYTGSPAILYVPQARAAAARALELEPNLAEAHAAMALIVQNHDWDWQTSEKEYRRAIELNPNYATGHQWYAEHLMWLGYFDEALKESQKAQQLDPLSLIIAVDQGAIFYYSRQYDRAIGQFRSVLQKDPTFIRARVARDAYVERGKFAQALTELEEWRGLYGEGPWYRAGLAYVYGRAGRLEESRRELEKLQNLSRGLQPNAAALLWAHLGVGDKEEALADLEKAYADHNNILTTLKVEPAFDPLRSDPRFEDLLRRVHLNE